MRHQIMSNVCRSAIRCFVLASTMAVASAQVARADSGTAMLPSVARSNHVAEMAAQSESSADTIVVTVCGLAVMVLPDQTNSHILLGASMASHLSNMNDDTSDESTVNALELADHYHSIRDNCKAVRSTNEKDALSGPQQEPIGGARNDEVI